MNSRSIRARLFPSMLVVLLFLSLALFDTGAGVVVSGTDNQPFSTASEPLSDRRVHIYWHDFGLTKEDAESLSRSLKEKGFRVEVDQHVDKRAPDSVFIGALVTARDARTVLSSLPYKIEYIFRPDYPEVSGGDPEGRLIGVGYRSTHMSASQDQRFRPVPVSPEQLSSLLDPGLSSTQFQLRLRPILNQQIGSISVTVAGRVDFGNFYALVIGNNNYKYLPRLENAQNDGEQVSRLLKNEFGFVVKYMPDATREDLMTILDEFRNDLSARDNLLIYYAGHGRIDRDIDRGYWLPVDAKENRRANWVSNADITDTLKALPAKHVLVVADSCYSGQLTRGVEPVEPHALSRSTSDFLKRMAEGRVRTVITSGGNEPVLDGGGERGLSIFATAFIDSLEREARDVIDATTLFLRIRERMANRVEQVPRYANLAKAGHGDGEFLFVRRAAGRGDVDTDSPELAR